MAVAAVVESSPINNLLLFHKAIRNELSYLFSELEQFSQESQIVPDIAAIEQIRDKYHFLKDVYSTHSEAEDEIIFSALKSKEVDISYPYCKEHIREQEHFEELSRAICDTLNSNDDDRLPNLTKAVEKMDTVQRTLNQHLEQEEADLIPLLKTSFDIEEQAKLIWGFFTCIPLSFVEVLLPWVRGFLSDEEEKQMLSHLRLVVPGDFQMIFETWFGQEFSNMSSSKWMSNKFDRILDSKRREEAPLSMLPSRDLKSAPLQHLVYIHKIIRQEAEAFISKLKNLPALLGRERINAEDLVNDISQEYKNLSGLVNSHCKAEDSIFVAIMEKRLLEEDRKVYENQVLNKETESHKIQENSMANLSVRMYEFRQKASGSTIGGKSLGEIPEYKYLVSEAEEYVKIVVGHLEVEEEELLPMLMKSFSPEEQRILMWYKLREMPIRYIGRLLSMAVANLSVSEVDIIRNNMRLAATDEDSKLFKCFSEWMKAPKPQSAGNELISQSRGIKRPAGSECLDIDSRQETGPSEPPPPPPLQPATTTNPIDHIFQFHRALGNEMENLTKVAELVSEDVEDSLTTFEGCFNFVRSIYLTHSDTEDKIVFPELDKKHTVSHSCTSYAIEHQKEKEAFEMIANTIEMLKTGDDELGENAKDIRRKARKTIQIECQSLKEALEHHTKKEEENLWPIFRRHFSEAEQIDIVGRIVGRTGAEVMKELLPFVTKALTPEERVSMFESMRSAAQNTKFHEWLSQQERREEPEEEHSYRPGWKDLFRLHQNDLQKAMAEPASEENASTESQRQEYLVRSRMTSQWILKITESAGTPSKEAEKAARSACGQEERQTQMEHGQLVFRSYNDEKNGILGCKHYSRKCASWAECCEKWVACRFCHDEEVGIEHTLDHRQIRKILCMVCGEEQGLTQDCRKCGINLGKYFCKICALYEDSPSKSIYHCQYCNICRVGSGLGKGVFHCMKCNCCLSTTLEGNHLCKSQALEQDCPICRDNLKLSERTVRELPCGHFMHSECFTQYGKSNYRCPICRKSMGDMTIYFRMLDEIVASEGKFLPENLRRKSCIIRCYDCGYVGETPYHYFCRKCPGCLSYNTVI